MAFAAPGKFVLGGDERCDVGYDAQVATVRKRGGADVDGCSVWAEATANLRAGGVEVHLHGENGFGVAWPVFAGFAAVADDLFERLPDLDGCAVHDHAVGGVDHCRPAIRAIDRDAVRDMLDDAVQHARPTPCIILGPRESGYIGYGHGPAAIGQGIGSYVDDQAIAPLLAYAGGSAAVG